MTKTDSKRESNIELLRVVAILMVISLHLCQGKGGFLHSSREGLGGGLLFNFLYSLSLCAVDVFLIISGYFSIYTKKRILGKPVELVCIGIFFKVSYYLFFALLYGNFEWNAFIRTFIPDNYFVNIFCVCYILSPYINVLFLHESKRNLNLLMAFSFLLFSIWPTIVNVFLKNLINPQIRGVFPVGLSGTDQGFTLVNFVFCYFIGAYTRITNFSFWKSQMSRCFFLFILLLVFTYLVLIFPYLRSMSAGLDGYDSIFTILIGWTVFMIFKNLFIPYNGLINFFAKSTFGVYIIHTSILWIVTRGTSTLFTDNSFQILILKFVFELLLLYFICVSLYKILGYALSPLIKIWRKSPLYNLKTYIY